MKTLAFILLTMAAGIPCARGAEAVQAQAALPDFAALRDPFLSALPKAKIIETPVEPVQPKINNTQTSNQQRQPPLLPSSTKPLPQPALGTPEGTSASNAAMPLLRVQGIIWGTDQPQAIINDTVVGVGDWVQGVKITSIRKNGVDGSFQGRKFHVHMDE